MPGIIRAREAGGLTQGTRGLIQNEITAGSRQFLAKLFCMPWKDEAVQVEVEQTYFVSTKADVSAYKSRHHACYNLPNVRVQFAQLLAVFYVDRVVILESLGNVICDPQAIFDTRLVGLR